MKPLAVVVLISAALSAVVLARSPSTTYSKSYRLVQPWSKLTTLSDEQRDLIFHIHRRSLDQIKQIEAQERKDILALLSDEQKLELVQTDEKDTVARKVKAAADRNPTTAATQSAEARDDKAKAQP
jgi:Tfp pilus assembly protein PilW